MNADHEQTMPRWMPTHKTGFRLWQHPMVWGGLIAILIHLMVLGIIWSQMTSVPATMAGQTTAIHVAIAMISHPQPPASKPAEIPQPATSVRPQVLTAEQSHRQEHLPPVFKPRPRAPKQRPFIKRPEPKIQPEHHVEPSPQRPVTQGNPDDSTRTAAAPQSIQTPLPVDSTAIHCTVPQPAYPPKARWLHQEGIVHIQVEINPQGAVTHSTIIQHSGSDLLDQAAMTAIAHTRCQPYLQQGHPVRVTTMQPFRFRLAS